MPASLLEVGAGFKETLQAGAAVGRDGCRSADELVDGGEAANVAEHHGDFGFARLNELRIHQQPANHLWAEILAERGVLAMNCYAGSVEPPAIAAAKCNACATGVAIRGR
jgi:hypothetical protein